MKKIALASVLFMFLAAPAFSQKQATSKTTKKGVAVKRSKKTSTSSEPVSLVNIGNYAAASPDTAMRIADPTIRNFNLRASGAATNMEPSGIIGVPKGTYGFANGRIFLRKTTATSHGTGYGSGAVGTGTSINGIGTSEATPGVNGKSPEAGVWLWGSKPQPANPSQQNTATPKKAN